ncbi:sigma-54 interaction domain-containing protein [Spongiibacter nanhainus]|nr:sigma 54-interacting transcriptional regulator [Spongiibacter nanhainus]
MGQNDHPSGSVADTPPSLDSFDFTSLLDTLEHPAILLSPSYRILASNKLYRDAFGDLDAGDYCYRVSHGYDRPCDQAGESCPLQACQHSHDRERVLHIHNTPRGREHVDVEMIPIKDEHGVLRYFIEMMKQVTIASAEINSEQMVGRSAAFTDMLELINLVAPRETSVLLLGESGTGKELAAKALHDASARAGKAMITVECAGLTETLFESELFGHVKGAFTGATQNKPGLLETAHGGTLFLDEIGDVPLGMQVKLLRLLETGTYRAVGSTQIKRADFRLVCATNKNLPGLIDSGEFREDLYYRINAFPIELPPLRERQGDIALIAESLLSKLSSKQRYRLTESAVQRLKQETFPGNIRELRNILERATIFAPSNVIDDKVLQRCLAGQSTPINRRDPFEWTDLKTQELRYLRDLLVHCQGDKERAAEIAGISVRSLYRKLELTP